jgi:hypothetical protein
MSSSLLIHSSKSFFLGVANAPLGVQVQSEQHQLPRFPNHEFHEEATSDKPSSIEILQKTTLHPFML